MTLPPAPAPAPAEVPAAPLAGDAVAPSPPAPPCSGSGLLGAPTLPERWALTAQEVAERFGLSLAEVRRLAHRGVLPGIRLGREWRFEAEGLRDWFRRACDPARRQAEAERRLAVVRGGRRPGRRR